jgi:hypothetical protein
VNFSAYPLFPGLTYLPGYEERGWWWTKGVARKIIILETTDSPMPSSMTGLSA